MSSSVGCINPKTPVLGSVNGDFQRELKATKASPYVGHLRCQSMRPGEGNSAVRLYYLIKSLFNYFLRESLTFSGPLQR